MDRLNDLLAEDLSASRFVTFAVAFLNKTDSHIRVLSAGHGPILLYRHDIHEIENLDAQGIPLGMIPSVKYTHATESHMRSGDFLALITDGFFEWQNRQGEEFGIKRLEEVIRASRDQSADEIITRLRRAVATFCEGSAQQDDLTVVILKRKSDEE